jgi:hypothetical protein
MDIAAYGKKGSNELGVAGVKSDLFLFLGSFLKRPETLPTDPGVEGSL